MVQYAWAWERNAWLLKVRLHLNGPLGRVCCIATTAVVAAAAAAIRCRFMALTLLPFRL